MGSEADELFQAWLTAPLSPFAGDTRFDVRRANPSEFDQIYDLVDETFDERRPRSQYEWLYRRNPKGVARCWIVIHKQTGRIVSNIARFPWPLARGRERIPGTFAGDSVTAPQWQRQGLTQLRREVRLSHPWENAGANFGVSFAAPNSKSRSVSVKYGRGGQTMGPLPEAAILFDSRSYLEQLGCSPLLAKTAGPAIDWLWRSWRRTALTDSSSFHVEEARRFDSEFDSVTEKCMSWPEFWCPHDSEFLNWRYLDHPTKTQVALSISGAEGLLGYTVVRLQPPAAMLMEFAAPTEPESLRRQLLLHATHVAEEAGCTHLSFFAPPLWRHWSMFRRVGFVPYRAKRYIDAGGAFQPAIFELDNWQLVPGDRDYR
jgi:hypothetical protein